MFEIVRFVQNSILSIKEAIDLVLKAINFVVEIFDQP